MGWKAVAMYRNLGETTLSDQCVPEVSLKTTRYVGLPILQQLRVINDMQPNTLQRIYGETPCIYHH